MSAQICEYCQAGNPIGARFCNNCGQPLPSSARPPTQAGEFDSDQLPDWLRAGYAGQESEPTEDDGLAELADWLTELGGLPLEAAPDSEEPSEDNAAVEPTDDAQQDAPTTDPDEEIDFADFPPDWLTDEAETPDLPAAADEDLPDWLSGDAVDDKATAVSTADEDLPDWLSAAEAEEPPAVVAADVDLPDWLGPAAADDEPAAVAPLDDGDDLPDEPAGKAPEPMPTTAAQPIFDESTAEADDDLPDWLRDDSPDQLENDADGLTGFTDWLDSELLRDTYDTADASADDDPGVSLTDWLAGDLTDDAPPAAAEDAPPAPASGLTDWLESALYDDLFDETPDPLAQQPQASLTDWLDAELLEEESEPLAADDKADVGLTDWLASDSPADPASALPLDIQDAGLTNWLDAVLADEIDAGVPSPPAVPDDEEIPDWLTADETDDDWFGDIDDLPPTGALPDWLTDIAPRGTGILGIPETEDPEAEAGLTEGLDWLRVSGEESDPVEAVDEEDTVDEPLPESDVVSDEDEWEFVPAPPLAADESLDWLSAMALEEGEAADEPASPESSDADAPAPVDDWLADLAVGDDEEVAGWFTGDTAEKWDDQADLAPEQLDALTGDEEPITAPQLKGVPPELAAANLPDWLSDAPTADAEEESDAPFAPGDDDLPEWMQMAGDAGLDAVLPPAPSAPMTIGTSEWDDIIGATTTGEAPFALDDLTLLDQETAAAGSPSLAASEIPTWMQALKPRELTEEADLPPEPEEPPLTEGPLAGLRGVIGIESVIARPRQATVPPLDAVSAQQSRQAALLRQLALEDVSKQTAVGPLRPAPPTAAYRLVLAALLLVAIITGLALPSLGVEWEFLRPSSPNLPPPAYELNQIIDGAGNRPVLIVFDYSPALAGELDPQAALLLRQMATNSSQALFLSQSPAGLAKGVELTAATPDLDSRNLGFLPGEALGLRYLATCFQEDRLCETLNGRELETNFSQVALILLITGERDNLVNWIEQVGRQTETPLAVIMTQSLSPTAAPYQATGQIAAWLDSPAGAAAYEQIRRESDGRLTANWQATALARWIAIFLLLGGNIWYGASYLLNKGRRTKGRGA